ncbi:MAG: DUF1036 domain-containing protein [Desulfovibrio sp.]|nr:DUF1036 domain-containing protein [Desulfovibrio sp.]
MKKVITLFFAAFLMCLLTGVIAAPNAHAAKVVITINNYTNKLVSFAFARENGYNTKENTTIGWYNVQPGSSKTIKLFNYNPNDNYYWYAKNSEKVITKSKDFVGWIVKGRAFKSINSRKLGGGSRVGFRYLKNNNGKATINIGKR